MKFLLKMIAFGFKRSRIRKLSYYSVKIFKLCCLGLCYDDYDHYKAITFPCNVHYIAKILLLKN